MGNDPMPAGKMAAPVRAMRAMKAMKVAAKAKGKAKAKAKAKAKPMKAMKAVKAMKRVSKIATGKKAYLQVYKGTKLKTKTGITKEGLKKSKGNKIVSAKRSEQAKNSKWAKAVAKARTEKGITGFRAIKKGGSFYAKAKE